MGLDLKARQHRRLRNPIPVPTPTPTHRQPQGSPPCAPASSGAPPRVAPRSSSLLERHPGKISSQRMARPTAAHENMASRTFQLS